MVQITHYTSPNYTDHPQVNIHCIENFFTVHDFWAICACPEKNRVALKIFTVLNISFAIQDFWTTCACPEKQSCPEMFTVLNILLHSGVLRNLRLPWKTECALNSQSWIYNFYYSGFLSNLRLPWKTELPWNFSLYWISIFYLSGFLSSLRLPWKTEFALIILKPGGGGRPPVSHAHGNARIVAIGRKCISTLRYPWRNKGRS